MNMLFLNWNKNAAANIKAIGEIIINVFLNSLISDLRQSFINTYKFTNCERNRTFF
jgi:hypothetical protein